MVVKVISELTVVNGLKILQETRPSFIKYLPVAMIFGSQNSTDI